MRKPFSNFALCGFVILLTACTPVTQTEATPTPALPPVYHMTFGEGERYAILADPVTGCQYIRYQAGFGSSRVAAIVPRYEYGGSAQESYHVRGCGPH